MPAVEFLRQAVTDAFEMTGVKSLFPYYMDIYIHSRSIISVMTA
jgi:hypothetical protein